MTRSFNICAVYQGSVALGRTPYQMQVQSRIVLMRQAMVPLAQSTESTRPPINLWLQRHLQQTLDGMVLVGMIGVGMVGLTPTGPFMIGTIGLVTGCQSIGTQDMMTGMSMMPSGMGMMPPTMGMMPPGMGMTPPGMGMTSPGIGMGPGMMPASVVPGMNMGMAPGMGFGMNMMPGMNTGMTQAMGMGSGMGMMPQAFGGMGMGGLGGIGRLGLMNFFGGGEDLMVSRK